MRVLLLLFVQCALVTSVAQTRPNTLALTCAVVRQTILDSGAVDMNVGPRVSDRFVADDSYCPDGTAATSAYVATIDTNYCFAGVVCTPEQDRPQASKIYSGQSFICEEGDTREVTGGSNDWNRADLVSIQKCINGKYVTVPWLP